MSSAATTRYGTTYDELCCGKKRGYSFNLIDLRSKTDTKPLSLDKAIESLIKQVDDTLSDIETQQGGEKENPGKEIEAFTIGKSHVSRRHNKKSNKKTSRSYIKFNRKKPNTWKLAGGINGRWKNYASNGYDGLIALAAITTSVIPRERGLFNNVEKYSLVLEQQLIHHYAYRAKDKRCKNTSSHTGKLCRIRPHAGIVYVAFKMRDIGLETDEEDSDQEASQSTDDDSQSTISSIGFNQTEADEPGPSGLCTETQRSPRKLTPYYSGDLLDNPEEVGKKKKRVSIAANDQIGSPLWRYEPDNESLPTKSVLKVTDNMREDDQNISCDGAQAHVRVPIKRKHRMESDDSENQKPEKQMRFRSGTPGASRSPLRASPINTDGRMVNAAADATRRNDQNTIPGSGTRCIRPRGRAPAITPPCEQVIQLGQADKPGAPVIRISKSEVENIKKCWDFLKKLIEMVSNSNPAQETVQSVKDLVHNLIVAGKIEPEEFVKKILQKLCSSPQPYLLPFLKKSVPLLREAMQRLGTTNLQDINPHSIQSLASTPTPTSVSASKAFTVTGKMAQLQQSAPQTQTHR